MGPRQQSNSEAIKNRHAQYAPQVADVTAPYGWYTIKCRNYRSRTPTQSEVAISQPLMNL